jgi:hypothetical protein
MKHQVFLTMFGLVLGIEAQAESYKTIYKTIDENGRVHFSDSPRAQNSENYSANGYSTSSLDANPVSSALRQKSETQTKEVDTGELEQIATDLKKERLQREKLRKKERSKAKKKRQQQKKKVAAKKKKIKACQLARVKEDKAFRKRMKAKDLSQSESALENYEKKRDVRKKKCQ